MKIVSLAENTTHNQALGAEHGLSLYIETDNHRILFDMGQSDLFARNAERLGIALDKVDIAVISHGHYDHGGGLKHFLEINRIAPVYISHHAFEPHYNAEGKYIGLDTSLIANERLIRTSYTTPIGCGLTLCTGQGRQRLYPGDSAGLTVVRGGEFLPDDFCHEQYLLIEEGGRRVLISGCSHIGIMDITNWFSPDVLIGGFHFSKRPLDDTLRCNAEYLDSFDTDFYTCHCTGTEQFEFMKGYMNRLNYLSTGDNIQI